MTSTDPKPFQPILVAQLKDGVKIFKQKEFYDQWVYYSQFADGDLYVKLWDEYAASKDDMIVVLRDLYKLEAINVQEIIDKAFQDHQKSLEK